MFADNTIQIRANVFIKCPVKPHQRSIAKVCTTSNAPATGYFGSERLGRVMLGV